MLVVKPPGSWRIDEGSVEAVMGEEAWALPQRAMIERERAALADQRVVAALIYGSFTRGEGDVHSNVEFALFFADDALPLVGPARLGGPDRVGAGTQ